MNEAGIQEDNEGMPGTEAHSWMTEAKLRTLLPLALGFAR